MAMRKIVRASVFLLACSVLGSAGVALGGTLRNQNGGHPITICHRTDSEKHPYVVETVDAASTNVAGHELHTGTVWFSGHSKDRKWGDIIPPNDDDHDLAVTSMNWGPMGQGMWRNGCKSPFGPPPQPPRITCTTISVDPQPVDFIKVTFLGTINGVRFSRSVSYGRPVPHLATADISDLTTTAGPLHIVATASWTLGPGSTKAAKLKVI